MPTALIVRCNASPEPQEGHVRVSLPLPFDAGTVGSFLRRGAACSCGARLVVDGVETPSRVTPENATESTLRVAIRAANTGRALVEWLCALLVSGAADEARKVALGLGDAMTHPDLTPPVEPAAEGEPGGGSADWWFAMMAHYGRTALRQSGADNFVMTVDEGDPDGVEVIVRRRRGQSPTQMIRHLRAEVAMLRRVATSRPIGKYLSAWELDPVPFAEAAVACDPAHVQALVEAARRAKAATVEAREAAEHVPGVAGAWSRYEVFMDVVWGLAPAPEGPAGEKVMRRTFILCDAEGQLDMDVEARVLLHLPGDMAAVVLRAGEVCLLRASLRDDDAALRAFGQRSPVLT